MEKDLEVGAVEAALARCGKDEAKYEVCDDLNLCWRTWARSHEDSSVEQPVQQQFWVLEYLAGGDRASDKADSEGGHSHHSIIKVVANVNGDDIGLDSKLGAVRVVAVEKKEKSDQETEQGKGKGKGKGNEKEKEKEKSEESSSDAEQPKKRSSEFEIVRWSCVFVKRKSDAYKRMVPHGSVVVRFVTEDPQKTTRRDIGTEWCRWEGQEPEVVTVEDLRRLLNGTYWAQLLQQSRSAVTLKVARLEKTGGKSVQSIKVVLRNHDPTLAAEDVVLLRQVFGAPQSIDECSTIARSVRALKAYRGFTKDTSLDASFIPLVLRVATSSTETGQCLNTVLSACALHPKTETAPDTLARLCQRIRSDERKPAYADEWTRLALRLMAKALQDNGEMLAYAVLNAARWLVPARPIEDKLLFEKFGSLSLLAATQHVLRVASSDGATTEAKGSRHS